MVAFVVAICVSQYGSAQEAWKEVRLPEGGFAVLMPGAPKIEKMRSLVFGPKVTNLHLCTLKGSDGLRYSVTAGDYRGTLDDAVKEVLDDHIGPAPTLRSNKDITLDGAPGKEIILDSAIGESVERHRIYLVKNRAYFIEVSLIPKGQEFSKETEKFLNSFKLLPIEETETPADQWKEIRSPEGGFSVLMPGVPTKSAMRFSLIGPSMSNLRTFGIKASQGSHYRVTYGNYSRTLDEAVDEILNNKGIISSDPLTLRSKKDITLNGVPGKEVIADDSKFGTLTQRYKIYLVKKRLYMVVVDSVRKGQEFSKRLS